MNKKKRQILEAAKTLFIEKGFVNTSINDVIELAKASKGTFYNHFSSKNSCLIAIIHDVHETTIIERKKIITSENKLHLQTLVKELTIFYQIVMASNLFDIMIQNIAFRENEEIIREIRSQSTQEINWLAQRLTEIFGQRISEVSYDCAALILGTIQHTSFLNMTHGIGNSIEMIIEETLNKVEPIVYSSDLHRVTLLPSSFFKREAEDHDLLKMKKIIRDLELFYENNFELLSEESKEYTLFLIELLSDTPEKKFVIEAVKGSFLNSLRGQIFETEATIIFEV